MTSPIPETKQPLTQGFINIPVDRAIPVLTHDPQGSSSTWENAQTDKSSLLSVPSLLSPGCAVLPAPAGPGAAQFPAQPRPHCQWPAWPGKPRWNVGGSGVTAPSPFSAVHWQCWCIPAFASSWAKKAALATRGHPATVLLSGLY